MKSLKKKGLPGLGSSHYRSFGRPYCCQLEKHNHDDGQKHRKGYKWKLPRLFSTSIGIRENTIFHWNKQAGFPPAPPTKPGPGLAGFSFKFPGGDWTVIGGEDGAPYEFYNANSGRRAVLREVALDEGEPMNLMDRAQMEMQSLEASGKKATFSELNPEEAFGTTGAFFDIAGKRYETPYEAVGLVTGTGNRVYTLTLRQPTTLLRKGALKEEWKEFFKGFTLKEIAEEQGPELSPERIQSHTSAALGYTWSTKDTLWHFWNGIAKQNNDPDLVLTDNSEDVSLFVYGAILPPDVINQQDMFKVLLTRLGVDPNNL